MVALKQQINYPVPVPVLHALENYIQNGDGRDVQKDNHQREKGMNEATIDTTRSTLIRYLVSAYGDQKTDIATSVSKAIEQHAPHIKYVTIRTTHPALLKEPTERKDRLIAALVYNGIPIPEFFDGYRLIP